MNLHAAEPILRGTEIEGLCRMKAYRNGELVGLILTGLARNLKSCSLTTFFFKYPDFELFNCHYELFMA